MARRELWRLPDGWQLREPLVVEVTRPALDEYVVVVRDAPWIRRVEGEEELAITMLAYAVLDLVVALREGGLQDVSEERRAAVQRIADKIVWDPDKGDDA